MRLAGQIKGGFFPCPRDALTAVLAHLRAPARFTMLDPCCGAGEAVAQLAEGLGCAAADVHAIELSDTRAVLAKQRLAGSKVQAPASFEGCAISTGSFGFIWTNSPFDAELGGGDRVEYTFLVRSTRLLVTKGVLAFCLPEYVVKADRDMQQHLMSNYRSLGLLRFPEHCRQYDECVIFGVKRSNPVASAHWEKFLPEVPIYEIPESRGPARFEKTELVASELLKMLARSPLRRNLLTTREDEPIARPPIPLGVGHTALLVASGQLDGIVRPPDEPPHVVRGTVRKRSVLSRVETKDKADGGTSTTEVYTERIDPIVRIATHDGQIITLGEPVEGSDE